MATTKQAEEVTPRPDRNELVKIRLPRQQNKGKGRHITVNNYDVFIPYGKEVEVPRFIVEVIENNARQEEAVYERIADLEERAQQF